MQHSLQDYFGVQNADTKRPPQEDTVLMPTKKHKPDRFNDITTSFHGNQILSVDDIQDFSDDDPLPDATNPKSATPVFCPSSNTPSTNTNKTPCKWLWQTDNKVWEEYSPEFSEVLEREFLGAKADVKVDNQRFVDLRSMLQRRFDDRNKVRLVKRERCMHDKSSSGVANKTSPSNASSPKPVNKNNEDKSSSTGVKVTKYSGHVGSDYNAKWYWLSETGWLLYDDNTIQKLEREYATNKKQDVRIDEARFVDLKDMVQRRYDQPTRNRPIKRECAPAVSNTFKLNQSTVISSPNKPAITAKSQSIIVDKENASKSGKLSVQWHWLSDDNHWHTYDATTASVLEEEYSRGNKEARVDEERFVDFENMLQRRFDNENKKRYIKRQVLLTQEQKERSERNRREALERLKAKGQRSILSFMSNTAPARRQRPRSPERADIDSADDDPNPTSYQHNDEAKGLENRRKRYKCGDDYTTLNQIETWEASLLRLGSSGKTVKQVDYKPSPAFNKKVSLWHGDITTLEIDAIVNAAKPSLLGGGGIDGAIHRAAGKSLVQECTLLDGCNIGDAKITSGHLLPASFVIHTVGPVGEDSTALEQCYTSSLNLLVQYSIRSVAFCCVSTGIYGYPNNKAARVALDTTRQWLDKNGANNIDRIIFCVFLDKDHTIYSKLMQRYFPPPISSQTLSSDSE